MPVAFPVRGCILGSMHEATGKTQILSDGLDPARAAAFHAALGLDGPAPGQGDPLPPFWHQLYFWEAQPPSRLGRDGHPKTGGFIPDLGLPRRMWAGGRLLFSEPLIAGMEAEKRTEIEAVSRKDGRTGPLAFVTLRHEFRQRGTLALTEWHELVYREDPDPAAPAPVPPMAANDETESEDHQFSSTLLFRYSTLTFNGHRIHYDLDYCREIEGYPGLVAHGPLLAQYLMLMAERLIGPLKSFSFRATAPLFHFETGSFCARRADTGLTLWVRAPDGRQCMHAEAS